MGMFCQVEEALMKVSGKMSEMCIMWMIEVCAWMTNGHVARHFDGFDDVHGGYGIGHIGHIGHTFDDVHGGYGIGHIGHIVT